LLPCAGVFGAVVGEPLPALEGTVAVALTKELATRDCAPDVAGEVPEASCTPVTVEDRREDEGALLEVAGEILMKLTGTVVVDAGALMVVVGTLLAWFVFDAGVAPTVEAMVDAGWITGLVLTVAAADVFVIGILIPALASVDATWV